MTQLFVDTLASSARNGGTLALKHKTKEVFLGLTLTRMGNLPHSEDYLRAYHPRSWSTVPTASTSKELGWIGVLLLSC